MFGDHQVRRALDELALIRQALTGVHEELKRSNDLLAEVLADE